MVPVDENGDFELEIDLSNFEGKIKESYLEHGETSGDDLEVAAPWDDRYSFWELYSEETLWKAKLLIEANRVEKLKNSAGAWSVEGSQHYLVHQLESGDMPVPWLTCSCPNGEARGGRPSCYHCCAVHMLILNIDLSGITKPEKKRPSRS